MTSSSPTTPLKLPAVLALVQQHHPKATIDATTQQIFLQLQADHYSLPCFLKLDERNSFLQIIVFLPTPPNTYSPSTTQNIAQIARFLHFLNKQVDLPGLCLDEESGTIFYRVILAAPEKKLSHEFLFSYLTTAHQVCRSFGPALFALSQGKISLEELLGSHSPLHGKSFDAS